MKVLVGCEESQTVCIAFRNAGYEAYSCDLVDTRGNPEWHIKGCVMDAIQSAQWDLIILHPPCTTLAISGNRWYGKGMPKHQERLDSIGWTVRLWDLAKNVCSKAALENPVGVLPMPVTQYIQPWQFGHGETKKTGLWLHGLPPLEPTNIVEGREQKVWKMPPSETRARDRSVTYQGIADAMVKQWGRSI